MERGRAVSSEEISLKASDATRGELDRKWNPPGFHTSLGRAKPCTLVKRKIDGPASAPSPARGLTRAAAAEGLFLSRESVDSGRRCYCRIDVALRNIFTLFELGRQAVDLSDLAVQISLRMRVL